MASRIFTHLVLVLGLLSSISLKAQQVSFVLTPSSITPNVGDVVSFDVVVTNFTNMTNFQYAHDWDPNLFEYVTAVKGTNMVDTTQLAFNSYTSSAVIVAWNVNGVDKSVPNGTVAYTLKLRVKAASTNYWVRFTGDGTALEVTQAGNGITPVFGNVGNPPGGTSNPVTIKTTSHTIQASQSVCVGVTADNFTNIEVAGWTMKWDSTVLRYESLTNLNSTLGLTLGSNFGTTQAVANGRLYFSWNNTSAKTLTSTDTIYKVCFTAIGAAGKSTTVSTLTTDSEIYRSDAGASVAVGLVPQNGTVTISSSASTTALTFSGTNVAGAVGDTVCVRVYAKNFKSIAFASWSMHWDSTKLSFVKARILNTALGPQDSLVVANPPAAVTNTSPNNIFLYRTTTSGSLVFFEDLSSSGDGVTLTGDSSLIYELCLRVNSGAGTTVPITFDGIPRKIQILDNLVAPVIPTFISGSVAITNTVTPAIVASGAATNVNCNAESNGAVSLTVSGGTGTFTYNWTGPNSFTATSKDISSLKAGKYYVTISSGSATPKVDSFTITEPSVLASSKTITNITCFGTSTGSVTLTPTGGTSPYTYVWSSGESTKDISAKAGGTYFVTITDTKGCTKKDTATINEATAITASKSITNVSCLGGATGSVTLTVAGGSSPYTYLWSSGETTKDIASKGAGSYIVTITDALGCIKKDTAVINEISSITNTKTVTNINCFGETTGSATLTVAGGTSPYTYLWSSGETTKDIAAKAAGSYIVTITDALGCTKKDTANITQPAVLASSETVTNVNCFGQSSGSATLVVTGGTAPYTYSWSSGETTKDLASKAAGTYIVTIIDSKGCVAKDTATITQPSAALALSNVTTNVTNCAGSSNGAINLTVTGGTPAYTYSWTGPNGFTATSEDISNIKAGGYSVTVTDITGCAQTMGPITITEPLGSNVVLGAPTVTDILCNGGNTGAINIAASGGTAPYTYSWSNGSTQQNLTGLVAGTYTVTTKDANGCGDSKAVEVKQNAAISITGSTSASVIGCIGTITLTVTGGTAPYTYAWTGTGVNATSKDQSNLCPNETYTVVVKDANNCSATKQFTLTGQVATPIRLTDSTVVAQAGCPGQNLGAININFTGGKAPFTFEWLNSAGAVVDRRQNVDKFTAGKYRVKITDAVNQTYLSGEIEVKGSSTTINISVANITSESCAGNDGAITMSISGGAAPYRYMWNDGITSRDRPTVKEGTYSVTVMDGNECLGDKTNIKVDKSLCVLSATKSNKSTTCFGNKDGSITINIQNGEPAYTIRWSANDSVTISNFPRRDASYEIKNLAGGAYTVTISDSKGQILNLTETVTQSADIVVNKTVKNDAGNCSGSVVLTVTGGQAPYSYVWNDGATSRDRFNQCANSILSVNVTDSRGCFKSTSNDTIKASVEPTTCATFRINTTYEGIYNLKCFDDKNASATVVTVTDLGLTPPFAYRWDNGESGPTATQLASGSRTVTVIGANGRTCNASLTIKAPDEIKVTTFSVSADCALEASVRGGIAPYSYKWSTAKGDTTAKVSGLSTGTTYYVIVKDKYGCTTDPGVNQVVCDEYCLKGPTVLTPNEDGKNDKFIIQRCDFKNVHLQVFNRWGQLAYENTDYIDQWEGFSRDGKDGKELPEGVYMYILTSNQSNGIQKVEKNTVTILRQ